MDEKTPKAVPDGEPTELTVDDVTSTSVTVNWNLPKHIGTSGLAGYIVEYCVDSTQTWVPANKELTTKNVLVIKNLTEGDKLRVRVKAVHGSGGIATATFPDTVLVQQPVARPKIRLPRNLRDTYIRKVGQKLNLSIPIHGNVKPTISWTKDGQPLPSDRVSVCSTGNDAILFIRTLERKDSGKYKLVAQVDSATDEVVIDIQVVGGLGTSYDGLEKPGPPQNLKLASAWGCNVNLQWQPPKDNGNAEISGYTIQKSDKKTGEWFTVMEKSHATTYTISNLVMGNHYNFRVFSENLCGLSETAALCKDTVYVPKEGKKYSPPEYKEKDFTEPPKFTQPPVDKTTTVGFTTKLFCSVRGNPKPKICWLKNKALLDDNPKFRILTNEGICTLEIRKPSNFDGGVYTCQAVNMLGEVAVDCRLDVKAASVA